MQKIKTFEDACEITGNNPQILPDVSMITDEGMARYILACFKLAIIAKALNGDWIPDFTDHNQWKYYPWFFVKKDGKHPSGIGFSYSNFDYSYALTLVGSRLCYKNATLAEYAGKTFLEIYRDHQLI